MAERLSQQWGPYSPIGSTGHLLARAMGLVALPMTVPASWLCWSHTFACQKYLVSPIMIGMSVVRSSKHDLLQSFSPNIY